MPRTGFWGRRLTAALIASAMGASALLGAMSSDARAESINNYCYGFTDANFGGQWIGFGKNEEKRPLAATYHKSISSIMVAPKCKLRFWTRLRGKRNKKVGGGFTRKDEVAQLTTYNDKIRAAKCICNKEPSNDQKKYFKLAAQQRIKDKGTRACKNFKLTIKNGTGGPVKIRKNFWVKPHGDLQAWEQKLQVNNYQLEAGEEKVEILNITPKRRNAVYNGAKLDLKYYWSRPRPNNADKWKKESNKVYLYCSGNKSSTIVLK